MRKEFTNLILIGIVSTVLLTVPKFSIIEATKNLSGYYSQRKEATTSMNSIDDLEYELSSQMKGYAAQSKVKGSVEIISYLEDIPGVTIDSIDTVNFRNGKYQEVQKNVTKENLAPHEGLIVQMVANEIQPVLDQIESAGIVCSLIDVFVPKKSMFLVIYSETGGES